MPPPAWADILSVTCHAACTRGPKPFQFVLIAGLGVDYILLRAVRRRESRGAAGSLGDGLIQVPAHAVVERKARRDLPGVLHIGVEVVAGDGRGTDVLAIGEIRGRDGHSIDKWAAGQESWKACRAAGRRIGCRAFHSANGMAFVA